MGSFGVPCGLKVLKVEVLVREGPWKFPDSVKDAPLNFWEADEMLMEKVLGHIDETSHLSRLEDETKKAVADVLKEYGRFDVSLALGQVRNFQGILEGRIFGNVWALDVGQVKFLLCLEDSWAECVALNCGPVVVKAARVVGLFGEAALLRLAGTSSAVIRLPKEDDPVRVVDLFAGIGGWSDPLRACWGEIACAVELDQTKAHALAVTLGIPLIDDVDGVVGVSPFVFCGDVFDGRWLKASWGGPFTVVLWSSPCVSWSLAGYASGLKAREGLLMLKAVGLLSLMQPRVSVGENVAAVVDHQHFDVVREFVGLVSGCSLSAKILELNRWSAMSRKRAFLFQGIKAGLPLPTGCLPVNKRQAARAVIEDEPGLLAARIPDQAKRLLQDFDLLPRVCKARMPVGFCDEDVLKARVEYEGLPTMMAAYRRQHELPIGLLRLKGLFTFLVREDADHEPRYLDHFEAARHLGFGMGLCLPEDDFEAAHAIGNSVAPVQAFEVLNEALGVIWPNLRFSNDEARKQIKTMLFGQGDLRRFTRIKQRKVQSLVPVGSVNGSEPSGTCLFWGGGCATVQENFQTDELASPYGYAWPVEEVKKVRGSSDVQGWALFTSGRLLGDNFVMKVEPWFTVQDIADSFGRQKKVLLNQIGVRSDQPVAWLTAQKTWKVSGVSIDCCEKEIVLIFEGDKRVGECNGGWTFAMHVDWLLPFRLADFIHELWNVRAQATVRAQDIATSGIFQVVFRPVPFWIGRYGQVYCLPLQKISDIQTRLAVQYHGGGVQVVLAAGGERLDPLITIALAEKIGPIEAFVLPCPVCELYATQPRRWARNGNSDGRMIQVHPFGLFWCESDTTVGEIGGYLEMRHLRRGESLQIFAGSVGLHCHERLLQVGRDCFHVQMLPTRIRGHADSPALCQEVVEDSISFFVQVAPYGYLRCDKNCTIRDLQRRLNEHHWGGQAVVRVAGAGRLLEEELFVSDAARAGGLRARVFPLGGGKNHSW